ncbi:ATP-binding cassette domain-containing protein [Anabaena sp. UHCC 0399]|uniref:ATP-binding cassette domain-containing protein n=1 Tax=Anabaena sp. UHCC 0399 TaxID=3110238 RepID=UPI003A4C5A06
MVLQDISFNLPAGQLLGLLGRTGSGKSSLAQLLYRNNHCPSFGNCRKSQPNINFRTKSSY